MLDSLAFVIFLVGVALVFDFINGFHDSANSIATVVSTQVLPPKYAVIWAAFFNFAAVFLSVFPWLRPSAPASSIQMLSTTC
jgi:inorganic phosphate transporter, PiT family